MEVKANKSVRFDSDTDLKFSKLSEKLGRSKQELFGQMVDYFYKSKKDPADLNDELLKKELGQGINRIISFVKTQEKEALTPMLADLAQLKRELTQLSQQYASFFHVGPNRQTDGLFVVTQQRQMKEYKAIDEQHTDMAKKLKDFIEETQTHQKAMLTHREEKKALKAKFGAILEHYILHRELLNAITQGRVIRELQENVQNQLKNL